MSEPVKNLCDIQGFPSLCLDTTPTDSKPYCSIKKTPPRKFRNKFVPSFENCNKTKRTKSKLNASKPASNTKKVKGKNCYPKTARYKEVSPKHSIQTTSFSSQYLDQLVEFEKKEKNRLEELRQNLVEEIPHVIEEIPRLGKYTPTSQIAPLPSSTISAISTINSKPSNLASTLALTSYTGSIPRQFIRPHGGVPYSSFHKFHSDTTTLLLALGDVRNKTIWDTLVPQIAYNSAMVSKTLVAFDALVMNKCNNKPNLENMALEHFSTGVHELSQAVRHLSANNSAEIYIASFLVGAFAIFAPEFAPIISHDGSQPEMFSIVRGIFNPEVRALFGHFQQSKDLVIPNINKVGSLDAPDPEILHSPKVAYFKLLYDQLESMEKGSTSISILTEPRHNFIDVLEPLHTLSNLNDWQDSLPQKQVPATDILMSYYDWGRQLLDENFYDKHSDSIGIIDFNETMDNGNTNVQQLSPDGISLTSSPEDFSSPPCSLGVPEIESDPTMFTLLPGELQVYRSCVLQLMYIVHSSTQVGNVSVLLWTFEAISPEFMLFLRQSRPMALVIAAYVMSIFWFKDLFQGHEGTYKVRMQELESMAPESWKPAFYWPKEILERHRLHESLEVMMANFNLSSNSK